MNRADREMIRIAARVGRRLTEGGWTVTTAESCTGGWIAKAITDVVGSSRWFGEGFVTYSNEAKARRLGVRRALLKSEGAVSEAVARAMARGASSERVRRSPLPSPASPGRMAARLESRSEPSGFAGRMGVARGSGSGSSGSVFEATARLCGAIRCVGPWRGSSLAQLRPLACDCFLQHYRRRISAAGSSQCRLCACLQRPGGCQVEQRTSIVRCSFSPVRCHAQAAALRALGAMLRSPVFDVCFDSYEYWPRSESPSCGRLPSIIAPGFASAAARRTSASWYRRRFDTL